MTTDENNRGSIDRRTYLSALAASTAAGLTGCSAIDGSNNDGSNPELGERVPELRGIALASVAGSENIQQAMLHVKKQMKDILGVRMNVAQVEFTSFFDKIIHDKRTASFFINLDVPVASRLDPSTILSPHHIRHAGVEPGGLDQYANCEFSRNVEAQASATDTEKRHEYATKAFATASKDINPIPLNQVTGAGVYRSDELVPPEDLGKAGVASSSGHFLWHTKLKEETNAITIGTTPGNMPSAVYHLSISKRPFFNTVYLPLVRRDKNYKLVSGIAKDWSVNGQKTFTFNLREDATFHNGEPVTAEDAKWTLEWINKYAGQFQQINQYDYESIKALDRHTLEVNLKSPRPSWLTVFAPSWSAPLPKEHWIKAGAEKGPDNISFKEVIGSGPYRVTNWKPRQLLALTPYEDHFIDAQSDVVFRAFADNQAGFRAFQNGTLNVLLNTTGQTNKKIKKQMGDVAKAVTSASFVAWRLESQFSFAPSMFREFRLAVSQALNRKRIRAYLDDGEGEILLNSIFVPPTHPYYPDDESVLTKAADSPQANPEKAKQILRDAGWGWDDQGQLHYPPDKDLSPAWPKGSSPCKNPDDWPCLPELCDTY